jgi:hypothetical protein
MSLSIEDIEHFAKHHKDTPKYRGSNHQETESNWKKLVAIPGEAVNSGLITSIAGLNYVLDTFEEGKSLTANIHTFMRSLTIGSPHFRENLESCDTDVSRLNQNWDLIAEYVRDNLTTGSIEVPAQVVPDESNTTSQIIINNVFDISSILCRFPNTLHDIKNPQTVLNGSIGFMKRKLDRGDVVDSVILDHLTRAVRGSKRLRRIVHCAHDRLLGIHLHEPIPVAIMTRFLESSIDDEFGGREDPNRIDIHLDLDPKLGDTTVDYSHYQQMSWENNIAQNIGRYSHPAVDGDLWTWIKVEEDPQDTTRIIYHIVHPGNKFVFDENTELGVVSSGKGQGIGLKGIVKDLVNHYGGDWVPDNWSNGSWQRFYFRKYQS